MKLNITRYKILKTRNYIKKNNFHIFFLTIHKKINFWLIFKQRLIKNVNLSLKNITIKILKKSIYVNFNTLTNKNLVLLNLKQNLFDLIFFHLNSSSFLQILTVKLNNKIYHKNQLKNNCSFSYINNQLLVFQIYLVSLKKKSK